MNSNQYDPNHIRIQVTCDVTDAAKLRMMIRGKMVPMPHYAKRITRRTEKIMSMSDWMSAKIHEAVKGVKLDDEARQWEKIQRARLLAQREKADALVAGGANRKPKSEWKKPGRVAGKHYDSYPVGKKAKATKKAR